MCTWTTATSWFGKRSFVLPVEVTWATASPMDHRTKAASGTASIRWVWSLKSRRKYKVPSTRYKVGNTSYEIRNWKYRTPNTENWIKKTTNIQLPECHTWYLVHSTSYNKSRKHPITRMPYLVLCTSYLVQPLCTSYKTPIFASKWKTTQQFLLFLCQHRCTTCCIISIIPLERKIITPTPVRLMIEIKPVTTPSFN